MIMSAYSRGDEYDYVIVGAGPAGCVLANRLTESADVSVLLIEAGGWDRSRWIHIPLGIGRILQKRMFDWGYMAEPDANVGGRPLACPRGKIVGGTSSINSMTFVRGHRNDYDRWAQNGLSEWSYKHVLPYFKKLENWEGGETEFRGGSGPIWVQKSRYSDALVEAYLHSAALCGYRLIDDYNAEHQDGFAPVQSTIHNGRRVSGATAYLHPTLRRSNLTVAVRTLATGVIWHGHRAEGVSYRNGRETKIAYARREVILSGGAINSPQLLMLSGIGDPDDLSKQGIKTKVALSGVGENLQDHVAIGIRYLRKDAGPFIRNLRLDRIALALARAELLGTGFAAEMPSRWTAFLRLTDCQPVPDIQLQFRAGPIEAKPYLPPFTKPFPDGFTCRAIMLHPLSRGRIRLSSADPAAPARIQHRLLRHISEMETLRAAFRAIRRLAEQTPVRRFIGAELAPGADWTSDGQLDDYIRATVVMADHPAGTCKMGPSSDPSAVVDTHLRVRGVAGLRVVDASVMPDLTSGNIIAPIYMMAERISDHIRGRAFGA